jgi:hypothetical protein
LSGNSTHPDAIMKIETGDDQPVNVRQYRPPQKHNDVVDAQIAKWLSKGHVTDQVPDNSWNIPWLVAPKKDEAGNVVGWGKESLSRSPDDQ